MLDHIVAHRKDCQTNKVQPRRFKVSLMAEDILFNNSIEFETFFLAAPHGNQIPVCHVLRLGTNHHLQQRFSSPLNFSESWRLVNWMGLFSAHVVICISRTFWSLEIFLTKCFCEQRYLRSIRGSRHRIGTCTRRVAYKYWHSREISCSYSFVILWRCSTPRFGFGTEIALQLAVHCVVTTSPAMNSMCQREKRSQNESRPG